MLQTIASRQIDITQQRVVVTVGKFEAGVLNNIVPETARLSGTIRTIDPNVRGQVHEKIQRIVTIGGIPRCDGPSRYRPRGACDLQPRWPYGATARNLGCSIRTRQLGCAATDNGSRGLLLL